MAYLHPAAVLFYGLALGAAASIASLAAHARRRDDPAFGQAAVALVGCLDTMSYLGGFSIGPVLILAAAPISIGLVGLARRHRSQTAVMALLSVTLALGMWTGQFPIAAGAIRAGLAVGIAASLGELVRRRRNRSDHAFGAWGAALVACLGGLSLTLGYPGLWPGSLWLAWAGVVVGLAFALLTPRARYVLLLLAAADLLLALAFLGY
jgi:hypothetical protein